MSIVNQEDVVGCYVDVTLVNGTQVSGTIFTYNPTEGVLVLLQNPSEENPSVKMIRTNFIKDWKLESEPSEKNMLPSSIEPFNMLPSMHAGRDKSIFKHASLQLKKAEMERQKYLDTLNENTPIAACDVLLKVARVYPDISWNEAEEVIRVNDDVIIVGDPDWTKAKATLVDGAPEKEQALVNRIQKKIDNK
ncbi:p21 antigen protein [Strigomonas culicis]|uniref:p21 antigen protein n=1 Tax=Strigomonas culicis TaxID=28005 RepID=S9UUT0_9TRYP|nr:p21 antigen protein [Strigomonas culicis]EPY34677.1 p21 antigen protein [Strigomonas culicis]|eukprot:EPY28769.1 p21 antigen protein [Strigomonas culicis]